ncbi:MAG: site-2 protease family protein [Pseudomonadota bacterium]|nr:site-2 protease family protein [Pseudomonadota bacterium]
MDLHNILITILVYAIPVVFAITLHEAAHGYVAKHFGDTTAYMLGRVSLNPVKHIDLLGTIVLPIVTLALSPFMFGWAKPVPVNFNNLRRPKADMLWVAAAGPGSNLAQLVVWAVVAWVLARTVSPTGLAGGFWLAVADAGIKVNIMFALLNLLPILPLDGGRMVASVLPNRMSYAWQNTERFGMVILLVLLFTGVIGWVLNPLYRGMYRQTLGWIGLG